MQQRLSLNEGISKQRYISVTVKLNSVSMKHVTEFAQIRTSQIKPAVQYLVCSIENFADFVNSWLRQQIPTYVHRRYWPNVTLNVSKTSLNYSSNFFWAYIRTWLMVLDPIATPNSIFIVFCHLPPHSTWTSAHPPPKSSHSNETCIKVHYLIR